MLYSSNLIWSSFTDLPPIKESILILVNFENLVAISWTWWANSLVLTITTACILLTSSLISFKIGIRYAAVFPVPFFALAIIDYLLMIKGIDSYWIGVGLTYDYLLRERIMFSLSLKSANDWNLVAWISFHEIDSYLGLFPKFVRNGIVLLFIWVWIHHYFLKSVWSFFILIFIRVKSESEIWYK